MASLTDNKQQELVFAFKTICQCEDRTAQWYLLVEDWSLQRATDRYYDDGCRPKTARDLNELIKQRMKADERAQRKAHELVVLFQPAPFGAHLQANMAQLLESETLSDVVLVLPSSRRIPAHRLVLSSASPVLAAALQQQRRSSESETSGAKQELVLDDERDEAAFRAVLAYVYTGRIAIAPERLLNVLAAAHRYGVEGLKERCGIHLFQLSRVDRHKHDVQRHDEEEDQGKERNDGESEADEIARLLGVAHEYHCRELERLCAEQLASRFPVLHASGQLNVLPLSTFVELIKSDKALAYEEDVLAAVLAYVDHNQKQQQQRPLDDNDGGDDDVGESADDLLSRLLLYVRFPFLPSACLVTDVERNQRLVRLPVVRDLLFEAYRYSFFRRFGQDTGPKEKQQVSTTTQQSSACEESNLGSSPPHKALRVTSRTGVLRWNAAKTGPELKLTQNELSVMHKGPSMLWSSAVSTGPFSADLTSAYVHVDRNASRFIVIGIVKEGFNGAASQRLGDDENGWGFCSQPNSAKVHAGSATGTYGTPFVTGDVIGVHLDQKKGELAFSCNGHHYGPAFVGLQTETCRYYLAVSLYHALDQVTLRLLPGKPTSSSSSDQTTDGGGDDNEAEQNHLPANDDDDIGFGLFE